MLNEGNNCLLSIFTATEKTPKSPDEDFELFHKFESHLTLVAWTNRGLFQIASCFHPGKSTEVGTTPPKPSTGPSGTFVKGLSKSFQIVEAEKLSLAWWNLIQILVVVLAQVVENLNISLVAPSSIS